jgi:hypothetical protein
MERGEVILAMLCTDMHGARPGKHWNASARPGMAMTCGAWQRTETLRLRNGAQYSECSWIGFAARHGTAMHGKARRG